MDYSLYHPDWRDIIRPSILKRDQYKCRVCGVRHKSRVYKTSNGGYMECDSFIENWAISEGRKVFTIYLQVAHLDHDKSNNDPSNLKALCPIHHAKHDKEHKKFKRLFYQEKIKVQPSDNSTDASSIRRKYITHIQYLVKQHTSTKIDFTQAEQILNECITYVEAINK